MRIAYIVGSFPHVSETFIVNQIAGMAARGHAVDVFTTCAGNTLRMPDSVLRHGLLGRTHRLYPSRNPVRRLIEVLALLLTDGWRVPGVVMRAVNIVRYGKLAASLWLLHAALTVVRHGSRHYDVIHAQFGSYGSIALRLIETGATSGAVVTSFRGFDATKTLVSNPHEYRTLFKRGALFLPVAETLARRLTQAGCDPGKVRVHRSGLDLQQLAFKPHRAKPTETMRILSIGRLVEKKGFQYGIEAVGRIVASGRPVQYAIVGDGPMRAELQALVNGLGLKDHVTFEGWKSHDEVLLQMQQAHVLLVPSVTSRDGDEEGIPNVAKEAMAVGLPVIATRHGGILELIDDGVSGMLVPERDSAALAARLLEFIGQPERGAQLSQAARRRIEAEYDIDRLNDELVALYQSACGVRGGVAAEAAHTPRRDAVG